MLTWFMDSSKKVKHYMGSRHSKGREKNLLPTELPASDDAENTQKAHSSFSEIEDRQSTVTSEMVSRYRIRRRPVASPAQSEGPYSSLSVEIETSEVPAVLPRSSSAPSMEEEQYHTVLEVMDFERFIASEPQHEREPTLSKPARNTRCGETVGDFLLPDSLNCPHKEWVPFMLRKTGASLLAVVIFMLVGLLEFLDRFERRRQGFTPDHGIINVATQFVPTILVVLLSFAWHMLVIDLKKITPFAAMSNKWAKPRDTILANYIDDLEMVSVWRSLRRRHWGMLAALLGGFVCGGLVPFANSLFYVDAVHESTRNSTLVRTSRFEFNGSLDAFDPGNPIAQRQMATSQGVDYFGSLLPPWTSSEYTFESFNLSDTRQNAALSVNSAAFDGNLDCATINYNTKVTREWYTEKYAYGDPRRSTPGLLTEVELIPNEEDMTKIGCEVVPAFYPKVIFSRPSDQSVKVLPAAWMNVTKCSSTEERPLTITTMTLLSGKAIDTPILFNVTGVLCRPQFSIRTLELLVNASTAEILEITLSSNTSIPVDIGIDSARLRGTIDRIGPANPELVEYNALVPFEDNYWDDLQHVERGELYHPPAGFIGRDPWFMMLSHGNASKIGEYATDMRALAMDSSQLFQRTMAQIADYAFRTNDSLPVPGFVKTREPRITIERSSLLFIQATLGFLGITAICCATVLRPKSCLYEDPATLGALSIIVASSEGFQTQIRNKGHFNDKRCKEGLEDLEVRLNADGCLKPLIEIRTSVARTLQDDIVTPNEGYKPLMLNIASRICLLVAITGTVVALGVLLRESSIWSGFGAQTTYKHLAWTYAPSATIVLLGYAIEGASSCTQALSSYMALSRGSVSGQKSLLFNAADHSAFAMFSYAYWHNIHWTFFTASITVIVYPAIKVMAAGLYSHSLGQHVFTTTIGIDQSFMTYFDRIPVTRTISESLGQMAIKLAVWTLTPQMQFPSPSGTAGSLIFSNLTSKSLSSEASQALDHGGSLLATVPALQVDVNCSTYTSEDFQVVKEGSIVRVVCKSPDCWGHFPNIHSALVGLPTAPGIWIGGFNISAIPVSTYYGYTTSFYHTRSDDNLAPISGLFMNVDDYGPNGTSANQRFNITPKAIAGYSCVRGLNKVNINVTFNRAVQPYLGGTSLLPLKVAGFDEQSILPANDQPPYSNANVTLNDPPGCVSSPIRSCGTSTSWFVPGSQYWTASTLNSLLADDGSTMFLGLLAATQLQYQAAGNTSFLQRLLEPEHLQAAAREAYILYSTQSINQLRSVTSNVGNSTVHRTATVNQQSLRAVQSSSATIALIVLLAVVLVCIIFTLWRVPSKPVIAKAPNSIVAQASLLAGSNLVRRLREEGVNSVAETNIWHEEVFSMGWWTTDKPHSGEEAPEERWGIDIGVARLRNTLEK